MRFLRIPLLCVLIVIALTGQSQAQAQFGCDDLTKSTFDILRIPFFCGKPGDTVLVPVILEQDSIVTSFQFLIQFDTAWLSPVFIRDSSCAIGSDSGCVQWNVDTTFIDHSITGRMLITDTTFGEFGPEIDTINQFTMNLFQSMEDVVAANMIPASLTLDSLPPGDDTIFYVKMVVNPAMPHGTLTPFTFFESEIFIVDDSVFPPDTTWFNGCNTSQMVTNWRVGPDSTIGFQIYPTTDLGYTFWFQADTACAGPPPPGPTVALSANPSSVEVNIPTSLGWTSTNADSVVVRDGSNNRLSGSSNGQTTGAIAWSSSVTGTFNFTATAYGTNGETITDNAGVVVTDGGTGGTGPIVSVSGAAASYKQGELINFTVTATNTNSSQISITASSMPANASFGTGGQVVGVTPLSGTFSWTPDFNQFGSYSIRFTASDNGGSTDRYVSLQIEELQFDRLFSTSRAGNRPSGGLRGSGGVAFPIDLVTAQTVYGVQFDMTYPSTYIRIDSFVTTARTPEYVVYDNTGQTPGQIRVVSFGLANEPVIDTNTTAILQAILTIDSLASPWTDYVIYLDNGRESVNPDPGVGSLPLVTDSGIVVVDSLGDVNLDRSIDVADVVNIVAYIIGNFDLPLRQYRVADLIANDSVNVFDLVADINMIFGEPLTMPAPPAPGEQADISLDFADLTSGGSDLLVVRSEIPQALAGVQMELNYNPSMISLGSPRLTADDAHYSLSANDNGQGRMKILLYNFAPPNASSHMQPGQVDLVEIPITAFGDVKADDKTTIRLTEALMSNGMAGSISVNGIDTPLPVGFELSQNYPNPFNPSTTIKFEVGVSASGAAVQDVKLDVFNILGQHVSTLAKGEYPAGPHEVVWDATNTQGQRVATGVYLYRLIVGDEHKTKKMLFLK